MHFETPRSISSTSRSDTRDDRFYTPRQLSSAGSTNQSLNLGPGAVSRGSSFATARSQGSGGSGEDWHTARYTDGDFVTPRDGLIQDKSYFVDMVPSESFDDRPWSSNSKLDDDLPTIEATEEDIEMMFSYARHDRRMEIESQFTRGIPVDIRDEYGNTMLVTACQNNNKRLAKALLRRGANINARNFKGNTPLHYCFHYGYGDSLGEYLISKGADTTIRNNAGKFCWDGI